MPIGVMHLLYLGLVKHLIRFCFDQLSTEQKSTIQPHLLSIDQSTFQTALNCDMVRYLDSRQAKDMKHYVNIDTFNFMLKTIKSHWVLNVYFH